MIYNAVFISAVQQSDLVIHVYIYSPLYSFPLWFITGYKTYSYSAENILTGWSKAFTTYRWVDLLQFPNSGPTQAQRLYFPLQGKYFLLTTESEYTWLKNFVQLCDGIGSTANVIWMLKTSQRFLKLQGEIGTVPESLGYTISITMEITKLEVKVRRRKKKKGNSRVRQTA